MADRYVATFDSLHPEHGVVVDEREGRYCTFPSVGRAERAAARWNAPPLWDADPPMAWRNVQTGELLAQQPADPVQADTGSLEPSGINSSSVDHTNGRSE